MTNNGGPVNEPTSYGLQPPAAGGAPSAQSPQPPQPPQEQSGRPEPVGYEPTRTAATPPAATPPGSPPPGGDEGTGRVIGGRYRLDSRLGHGGMGTVWRAHDQVVDREVAVKEPRLPENLSEQERETMYQRMRREARAAARIDHPAIVTVHDVVVEDGRPWLVMELVRGRSLGDVLAEGTLDVREAARIGAAVVGALGAAHEAGVLHRDIKPDNVLLGRHDRVVLTDFGIAQVEGEQGLTETGAFVGSPEFIAPERVLGQRPGPESDLWSLGVVLYAAVEGVSPFRRTNTPATLQAVLSAEPQMPARASGAMGTLIMQLLRKDPGMRPSAAELRRTLEEAARPPRTGRAGQAGPTAQGGTLGATRAYGRRLGGSRKARFGAGGGVLAVVVALLLIFANPFTDDGAPDGWTLHKEDKRVSASVAVPDEYLRSADENNVTYKDPGGVFTLYLSRETGIEGTLLEDANVRKGYYEEGAEVDYSDTMADVTSRVEETKHQGTDAAKILTTWREPDHTSDTGAGELLHRRLELTVVNDDQVRWRLYVDMPGKGKNKGTGEEIFENAVESLRISDL